MTSSNNKLDFEVTVEDAAGHTISLKVWSTHSLSLSLTEGHQYELENVRGRYWSQGGTRHYQLDSTKDLTVTELGPPGDNATRLLIVGDTHVGYRHRRRDKKAKGARELDARDRFRAVMNQANTLDADGVIHAGDIFDHVAIGSDRSFVINNLKSEFNIPFYYIYGNHDEPASRRTVDGATEDVSGIERLSTVGESVGEMDVTLFGIDYSYDNFPGQPLKTSAQSVLTNANVLVVHDTPYPVQNGKGHLMYQKRGADFRVAVKQTSVDIDLIVSGHMHVGQQGTLDEFQTPVLVTGAPTPINNRKENNNPSTWLLRVTEDGIDGITRHPL
ncbi:metallophosphoesterase family protein [Natronosalvus halobius]|uniref:metallophosphoesterase family protein n=1 Tax=Natronosalvus halobius TaxID=2953746 RepID=UPI00209CF9AA|nr:metallophosphoesterase [Natronosalvus halobius]USZ73507.1 metallophosphoesterase [Natronosalvus halobius]